jgi:hypothetical protein
LPQPDYFCAQGIINMDTEPNEPITQAQIYRAMTMEQRLQVAMSLYDDARAIITGAVRSFHPEWTEEQVRAEVRRRFLYA